MCELFDYMSAFNLQSMGVTYVLNVSMTCPKPAHIQDSHFLRIPVNDNYSEKLLPHFHELPTPIVLVPLL